MSKTDQAVDLVKTTQDYYDSEDADNFYHTIWGGEDIHVGIYLEPDENIATASNRTVKRMVELLPEVTSETKILDVGAGYGGAARYLASNLGCNVTCLNLSEKENERNREKNAEVGLADKIEVVQGNFEDLPFDAGSFDIVWCEDSILHSKYKAKVLSEVKRVLKSGGSFIFSDPMQSDDCPDGVLDKVLARIHLEEMGSVKKYREIAKDIGLEEKEVLEMPEQLVNHYSQVQKRLRAKKPELSKVCSEEYITRMDDGLQHWINGGNNGYLNWGILHFIKP